MKTIKNVFVNELGNTITMIVKQDRNGVTVKASGPTSYVEHTWTPNEALEMVTMLAELQIDNKRKFD